VPTFGRKALVGEPAVAGHPLPHTQCSSVCCLVSSLLGSIVVGCNSHYVFRCGEGFRRGLVTYCLHFWGFFYFFLYSHSGGTRGTSLLFVPFRMPVSHVCTFLYSHGYRAMCGLVEAHDLGSPICVNVGCVVCIVSSRSSVGL
jgi:hypothetical protein